MSTGLIVLLVDRSPDPWSWDWWTQFAIPLSGVVASLFVGIVAIVVAFTLSNRDRESREYRARARVVNAVDAVRQGFLDSLTTRTMVWVNAAGQLVGTLRTGAQSEGLGMKTVQPLVVWILREANSLSALVDESRLNRKPGTIFPESAWVVFDMSLNSRLGEWQEDGRFRDVRVIDEMDYIIEELTFHPDDRDQPD